jgi:hypothetical protein
MKTLRGLRGGLIAKSQSGRVSLEGGPTRAWDASTGSGSVEIGLDAAASVTVDSGVAQARSASPAYRCKGPHPRAERQARSAEAIRCFVSQAAADLSASGQRQMHSVRLQSRFGLRRADTWSRRTFQASTQGNCQSSAVGLRARPIPREGRRDARGSCRDLHLRDAAEADPGPGPGDARPTRSGRTAARRGSGVCNLGQRGLAVPSYSTCGENHPSGARSQCRLAMAKNAPHKSPASKTDLNASAGCINRSGPKSPRLPTASSN